MKLSFSWLKRYIPALTADFSKIDDNLTSLGFEVEGIENQGELFAKIIVAKVVESGPHPDADSLTLNKVFDGEKEIQVVCGGSNVKTGITVAFAPVKTILPLADGTTLKLKKAKIRGQESLGMICSTSEIGLGECIGKEIMILPDGLKPGTPLHSLGYYDTCIEIDVTPNRPDALSHMGVARELAAGLSLEFTAPSLDLKQSNKGIADAITIDIQDQEACTKYTAKIIKGLQVTDSPAWLQNYLNTVGIRPINNVVDVTNFVLMEWGQPLHAFDLNKFNSQKIVIRCAQAGETLVTLDDQERKLISSDLLICDGDTPACLAGVMGGKTTEVDHTTVDVLLETAYFKPSVVRKQSRRLGLMSDSSYRFERGVDPLAIADVSNYAIALLKEVCGGEVLNGTAEETTGFHKQTKSTIPLRPSRVKSLLGMDVPADKIKTLLHSIECHLTAAAEDQLVFNVPGFRPDLEREVDLIEEIARLIGYDEIPVQTPKLALQANPLSKKEQVARVIRTTLASLGLNEGLSLRFNSKKDIESLFSEGDPRREPVALQNPISEEWGVLPTSLLPRLLHSVSLNLRNQEKQVRLFEISRAYFNDLAKRSDRHPGIKEQDIVSGVIAGDWEYAGLGDQPAQVEFLDLKTIVESLFKKLNLAVVLQRPAEPIAFLHPLQQVEISLNGIVIGCVGGVHPKSAKEFGIKVPTIVFEFELAKVEKFALHQPKFKPFSKFGEMVREVNIIVDESFDQAEMLKKAQNFKAKNLVDIRLRSSYKGKGVPEGKKSLLYQFVYQSAKQTLTDELVNKAQDKLTVKLGEDPSIEYR